MTERVCGQPLTNTEWCEEAFSPEHSHEPVIDRTLEHLAYVDQRYHYTDDNNVDQYGDPYPVRCGSFNSSRGGTVMCDACEEQAETDHPQGWRYYPGDVCKHGVYTGGSGIDWMCQACEDGE
jgi:hypothetical protein